MNGDVTGETLRVARETLEHYGGSWRANKNALLLIAARHRRNGQGQGHGPHSRSVAELGVDKYRIARFNAEQRDQLTKRLSAARIACPSRSRWPTGTCSC